jgi:hypothetical protein
MRNFPYHQHKIQLYRQTYFRFYGQAVLRSSAMKAGNNSPATSLTPGPNKEVTMEWTRDELIDSIMK